MKVIALLFVFLALAAANERVLLGHRSLQNTPSYWKIAAEPEPSSPVTFHLALRQHNLQEFDAAFKSISEPDHPNYRNFMTIKEIQKMIAPPQAHSDYVKNWVVSHGGVVLRDLADSLVVRTSVSNAEKMLQTKFYQFEHTQTKKKVVRQFGDFSLPADISEYVELVFGLSEMPEPKYSLKKVAASEANAPQTCQHLYKTGSTRVMKNSSLGVIEFESQYFSVSYLQKFATEFGLTLQTPTPAHTIGHNNPNEGQIEADLDIQWGLGVGAGAESWFWIEGPSAWVYGFSSHFFATPSVPLVFSVSYGWDELKQCQAGIGGSECNSLGVDSKQYVARVNIEFQKIGARGISILVSSGDSGANGRTDTFCTEQTLNPPYPAASPYVTAVGATQIRTGTSTPLPTQPTGCSSNGYTCVAGGTEDAVSFAQAHFASGGGFSFYAPRPTWQDTAVNAYLNSGVTLPPDSYYNKAGRGFPDVAALGTAILIIQGGIEPVGGTSASSPIVAGVVALLNDIAIAKDGKPLGFLNPLLYKMAAEMPTTFTDVTVGDNLCTESGCHASCKGFKCTKGWDPVTGLGSPVYTEMKSYIMAHL